MNHDLTPQQQEYFRMLEEANPNPRVRRAMRGAKHDLEERARERGLHLGESRMIGFQPNPKKD